MTPRSRYHWSIFGILAIAFGLRVAAGYWWQQRLPAGVPFAFGDSEGYWELARTIARGEPYEYSPIKYRIFRTPGYPAILAPLFVIRDEPPVIWGRMLSAVLGAASVGGVMWLARIVCNSATALPASLIAGAIAAIYPEAIAAGVFVLSEAPFCPLMLGTLAAWAAAWKAPNQRRAIGWALVAGVLAGLATLMRPSFLLFVPFAGAIGIALGPDRRKHSRLGALTLLGLCVTMTPWWIRNYKVAGRFVPTSLQVGASLYDGLNPKATGGSEMSFVPGFVAQQRADDAAKAAAAQPLVGLFEDRLDARMREASIAWVRQNPSRALALAGTKFLRMWSPLPNAAEFSNPLLRLALALSYVPVLLLAAVGIWQYVRRDWPYLLLLLPVVYFTLLHVVFVSSIRYRQPAMLALIILAATVLAAWYQRRAKLLQPSNP
jgi:4-amino-4-deoxy-L-arabinose transferase-like glycosyltransferase